MPFKVIRKLSPRRSQLTQRWFLRPFGAVIHDPSLWRLDRHGAAMALAVGFFMAWMPLPFQMVLAALTALVIRVHLPLAVAAVWISNPVTTVPMFYIAYRMGLFLLGGETGGFSLELSMEWLAAEWLRVWRPFLLGSLVMGVFTATLGYFALDLLWHWALVRKFHRIQAAGRRRVSRELLKR